MSLFLFFVRLPEQDFCHGVSVTVVFSGLKFPFAEVDINLGECICRTYYETPVLAFSPSCVRDHFRFFTPAARTCCQGRQLFLKGAYSLFPRMLSFGYVGLTFTESSVLFSFFPFGLVDTGVIFLLETFRC